MEETFSEMLLVGGKSNSLGRANEVIEILLDNRSRLGELYECLSSDDAWIRMRAIDAIEKICRIHPDWILPILDRLNQEYSQSTQPSIQWHLAQIYAQLDMSKQQQNFAINWLKTVLSSKDIDRIVAANSMDTLMNFTRSGLFQIHDMKKLLDIQKQHKSNAVTKRADKYLTEVSIN